MPRRCCGQTPPAPRCSARRHRPRLRSAHSTARTPPPPKSRASRRRCGTMARARLERLRGFGAAMGGRLTCACARLTLADGTPAVLIAALDRSGPDLSTAQRVRRLLAACVEPVAVFGDDGVLIDATPAARKLIGDKPSLDALGARALVAAASASGHAAGTWEAGAISIDRIRDPAVWIAAFGGSAVRRAAAPAAEPRQPLPAPAPEQCPRHCRSQRPATAARNRRSRSTNAARLTNLSRLDDEPQTRTIFRQPVAEQPELFPELAPIAPRAGAAGRRGGTAPSAALRLADGSGRPLHHRLRRIHRADGAADRGAASASRGRSSRR